MSETNNVLADSDSGNHKVSLDPDDLLQALTWSKEAMDNLAQALISGLVKELSWDESLSSMGKQTPSRQNVLFHTHHNPAACGNFKCLNHRYI